MKKYNLIEEDILTKELENTKYNSTNLLSLNSLQKNTVLENIADNLKQNIDYIIKQNKIDIENAKQNEMKQNLIDRLLVNKERLVSCINGIHDVIALKDYVGDVIEEKINPKNNLKIQRVRVPIGTIMMIYEARPLVGIDASILCLKSSNNIILKPAKDSINTSTAIYNILKSTLDKFNISSSLLMLNPQNRNLTNQALKMNNFIDLIIPRGGKNLIQFIMENTNIPILKHLDGNCHTYIHKDANLNKAVKVLENAKLRRTSVCGATESLLIDREIANNCLLLLSDLENKGCFFYCCSESFKILKSLNFKNISLANESDFYTEYLDAKMSIKLVNSTDEAISHINKYSSSHTDCIITDNQEIADKFCKLVDSAIVAHNCSTQFADGYELGLGAEIGISTNKIHARGPIALEGLTTYKWKISGDYTTRSL